MSWTRLDNQDLRWSRMKSSRSAGAIRTTAPILIDRRRLRGSGSAIYRRTCFGLTVRTSAAPITESRGSSLLTRADGRPPLAEGFLSADRAEDDLGVLIASSPFSAHSSYEGSLSVSPSRGENVGLDKLAELTPQAPPFRERGRRRAPKQKYSCV
jgi:hypothetical protein